MGELTIIFVLGLLIGVVASWGVGFSWGRNWSERHRGRYDAHQAWDKRKAYRAYRGRRKGI